MIDKGKVIKSSILFIIIILLSSTLNAQVTIGAALEPDTDALLDLKEQITGKSNKGLLLPRVSLKASTNSYPCSTHVAGMIVYNTATVADVNKGLYYNNGTKWLRMGLPDGGLPEQVLALSSSSQPQWVTLNIPDIKNDNYVLTSSNIHILEGGGVQLGTTNNGLTICANGYTFDSKWKQLGTDFVIQPKYKRNRLYITMQTVVQKANTSSENWVSYAGGVFINSKLKVANIDQIIGTDASNFTSFFVHGIVENIGNDTPGDQIVRVAVTRVLGSSQGTTSSMNIHVGTPFSGATNLNDFMARPSIYLQYYEDPTSDPL
ncbi:hypothetical protein [Dysgonomonas sp. BGC7]|uniref:hypothetical protein n=1 Tax=Dysgonomonas sp. BGC7 TaxID=1658008 RepID=UPI00067FD359|nr:hypothetical protein [Dysgonomonas sp. BGC7]MBD8388843.1 hypothetical protein [Dysgonomonas sp. BGC7]